MWKKLTVNKNLYFIYAIVFITLLLTTFKIHGSSIGIYNKFFYGQDYKDDNLLFGKLRPIRSDEWVVQTPLTISESQNNFKVLNPYLGVGQSLATFLDIPTRHWSTFFKPMNFSFFVLPLDFAYSFKWWFRAALLLISCYLLLNQLFKKNLFFSIIGSLILFFSPFIQWWYSVSVIEVLSFGMLIAWAYIKLLTYKSTFKLAIYSILLWYFLTCFLLILYPPFQISVGLLVAFFSLGYTCSNKQLLSKEKLKILLPISFAILISALIVLLSFYIQFKDVITIVRNTQYPGKREAIQIYSFGKLFSGFFNFALLSDQRKVPLILGNQSEASSFLLLSLFILPLIIFQKIKEIVVKKKIDYLNWGLLLYLFLALSWLFLKPKEFIFFLLNSGVINSQSWFANFLWLLDSFVNSFYSLFLLPLVPPNRLIIGIGLVNLLLILYFLNSKPSKKRLTISVLTFSFIGVLAHIQIAKLYLYQSPNFLKNGKEVIGISIIVFLFLIALQTKMKKTFLIFLLIFSVVTTISVNPLYKGLSPITSSEITTKVKDLNNNSKKRWMVFDYMYLANYLAASGVNVLDSVQTYPQFKLWDTIDPDKKYYKIYNRYAHINAIADSNIDSPNLSLAQPDLFFLRINPCDQKLDKLNVNYFIFDRDVNYPCLQKIDTLSLSAIHLVIYQK